MKASLVSLMIMISATSALADLNGIWSGKGNFTDGSGRQIACDEITYQVRQTRSALTVKYGFINCAPYSTTVRPFTLIIRGNHLLYKGQTVGTFQNDKIHIEGLNGETIDATLSGNSLSYVDSSFDAKGNQLWLLQGNLNRR